MFTLADLTKSGDDQFANYVRQKSGFLLSNPHEQTQFLWKHILDTNNFQSRWESLDQEEKDLFFLIFYNYGYLSSFDKPYLVEQLEKKLPYLFYHPLGGVFIPVEFFKLFMKQSFLQKKFFSFSLLYQMNLSTQETKNFLSLVGTDFTTPPQVIGEKNSLDKALIVYLFLSGRHRKLAEKNIKPNFFVNKIANMSNISKEKNKHAYQSKDNIAYLPSFFNDSSVLKSFYPPKPVNLWEYLHTHFQEEKENVDLLYFLLQDAKKEFYRSLALLPQKKITQIFSWGYLFPIFSNKNIDDIQVVCPQEIRYQLTL